MRCTFTDRFDPRRFALWPPCSNQRLRQLPILYLPPRLDILWHPIAPKTELAIGIISRCGFARVRRQ
jgi:hypothetical protein